MKPDSQRDQFWWLRIHNIIQYMLQIWICLDQHLSKYTVQWDKSVLKMPRNTRLKPYTTRMAKIQGPNEGKTYSNIYKEEWIQP